MKEKYSEIESGMERRNTRKRDKHLHLKKWNCIRRRRALESESGKRQILL